MIKETLIASDYIITEKRSSQIDASATYNIEIGIRCPHCKTILRPINHGESQRCACGLVMTLYGNMLVCTL